MICEGRPLIIGCERFKSDPEWLFTREDIEVFTDLNQEPKYLEFVGPAVQKARQSDDEDAFAWVTKCFHDCSEHHPQCIVETKDFQGPKRLLYVGESNDELRIVETVSIAAGTPFADFPFAYGKSVRSAQPHIIRRPSEHLPRCNHCLSPVEFDPHLGRFFVHHPRFCRGLGRECSYDGADLHLRKNCNFGLCLTEPLDQLLFQAAIRFLGSERVSVSHYKRRVSTSEGSQTTHSRITVGARRQRTTIYHVVVHTDP